ncbi:MAG TPA: DciA family protein [Candidatus Polarisedimenticolia bacterium]|nr:DciA family protein [Candidatus Polarisedimenticolia bacterium]
MDSSPRAGSETGVPALDPVSLLRAWWETVGAGLARVASPRGVEAGFLRIAVPDPRWEREMTAQSEGILERLRGRKGLRDLRGIELVVEPSPPPPSLPHRKVAVPREVDPPMEILRAASSIADPVLAERWARAVGRLLSRAGGAAGS